MSQLLAQNKSTLYFIKQFLLLVGVFIATTLTTEVNASEWNPELNKDVCEVRIKHKHPELNDTFRYYNTKNRLISGTKQREYDSQAWENFFYDDKGQLIKIISHYEREVRELNLEQQETTMPRTRVLETVDLRYDDRGSLIRKNHQYEYFSEEEKGKFVVTGNETKEVIYSYDEKGHLTLIKGKPLIHLEYADARLIKQEIVEGNITKGHSLSYDQKGRLKSTLYTNCSPDCTDGFEYQFKYDDKDRIIRRDMIYKNDSTYSEVYSEWLYNSDGFLINRTEVEIYAKTGKENRRTIDYEYDHQERLIAIIRKGTKDTEYVYSKDCGKISNPSMALNKDELVGKAICFNSPYRVLGQFCVPVVSK